MSPCAMIRSPGLYVQNSSASAIIARSFASNADVRLESARSDSERLRFCTIRCITMVRNVRRSIAHSVTGEVDTTDAARGVLYLRAAPPSEHAPNWRQIARRCT